MATPYPYQPSPNRPADENLPEVAPAEYRTDGTNLPEVVPNTPQQPGSQPYHPLHGYYSPQDKYPAYFDDAPKLPKEDDPIGPGQPPVYSAGVYAPVSPQWAAAGIAPGVGSPVSPATALSPEGAAPWQPFPSPNTAELNGNGNGDGNRGIDEKAAAAKGEKRICGIRKKLFMIIAGLVALVVIAAAVGGGVGGAIAAKEGDDEGKPQAAETTAVSTVTTTTESESTTTPPPTTTTSSISTNVTTTTSAALPTLTDLSNQTTPPETFAFQAWSKTNYKGNSTEVYFKEGFFDFGFQAWSYIWISNTTNCCITFCKNETTSSGWWCDTRYREATEAGFGRISIWCGRKTNEAAKKKCS